MAQFARPISDLDNTGVWTTTPLWSDIDDGASPDGTVVVSDTTPVVTEPFTVDLGTITDPTLSTGHILRIRWAKNAGGAGSKTIRIELRQGYTGEGSQGTLIATDDYAINSTTLRTDATTLSGAEADAITDYSDLQIRIMGVSSNRALKVDFAELETPDVPTNYTETVTEAVGVTDDTTPVKAITPAVTEAVGVTDSTIRVAPAVRSVVEAVGVTDSTLHDDPTLQYIYPDGDILSGGWETAPTAGQNLADQLDEDPPDDTDYIFEEV